MKTLVTIAFCAILAACSSTSSPAPDMNPGDAAVGDAAQAPDLAPAPALLSASPSVVSAGTVPSITVTGNDAAALDKQQGSMWSFGACSVAGYTYVPVDAAHCVLQPQIPANAPAATCDLALNRPDGVLLLKAAFAIQ